MRRIRRTAGPDRTLLFILGLLAIGVASLAAAWVLDHLGPRESLAELAAPYVRTAWWPYAVLGAAVLLVAIGLWWLVAHRPGPRLRRLTIPGSTFEQRLQVQPDAAVSAANELLARRPEVSSSRLRLVLDHGTIVVSGRVSVRADADIAYTTRQIGQTLNGLATVLGMSALETHVRLDLHR